MVDQYFISEVARNRWFGDHFSDNFQPFGYVGDRDKLTAYQADKSLSRKLAELLATQIKIKLPSINIAGVNFELGKGESEITKQIINLINEAEKSQPLKDFLAGEEDRLRRHKRSFDSVESHYNRQAVMEVDQSKLQGELVAVKAQILNRTTISQYAPNLAQLLDNSDEWLLSDFPPHDLSHVGKLIRLKEDQNFSNVFAKILPFARHIGWYPYCKVTGFYEVGTIPVQEFPRMSMSFVEYRPPKSFKQADSVLRFIEREMGTASRARRPRVRRPNVGELEDLSEKITALYLLPIITASVANYRVPGNYKNGIVSLVNSVGDSMPDKLRDWYNRALS